MSQHISISAEKSHKEKSTTGPNLLARLDAGHFENFDFLSAAHERRGKNLERRRERGTGSG
jgi:hypothetical protein